MCVGGRGGEGWGRRGGEEHHIEVLSRKAAGCEEGGTDLFL